MKQFDVKTAFLYSKLDEDIYTWQPEGYDDGSGRVWKLKRSLYGLKQSPRCWNKLIMESLLLKGFNQSTADPCLYIRNKNGNMMLVLIYVDDGLIAGSSEEEVSSLITQLERRIKLKVTNPECYLGMEINKTENGISLSQTSYIKSVLERYKMFNTNHVSTPLIPKSKEYEEGNKPLLPNIPFREAVGSLMYTRPGI